MFDCLAANFSLIVADPPIGVAVTLLLGLATAWGVTLWLDDRYGRAPRPTETGWSGKSSLEIPAAVTLIVLFLWLAASLVTVVLLRILGAKTPFEAVFCLLVFAGSLKFLSWLTYPARNVSYISLQVWRSFAVVVLVATTWAIWMAFDTVVGLTPWKTVLAILPSVGLIWAAGIWEIVDSADSIRASRPWRRIDGRQVAVFLPLSIDAEDFKGLVKGCDDLLAWIAHRMEVDPLPFKVFVFFFEGRECHYKIIHGKGAPCLGYSHGDSISLVLGNWHSIKDTVAHEFCHVLREQRITKRIRGLLDEGLAEFITAELRGTPSVGPHRPPPIPLRAMAFHQVFYDGLEAGETFAILHSSYAYAHRFARYLIEQYGIEKYKQLCREAAGDYWTGCGDRLARAVARVYGIPLSKLEDQWR